MSVNQDSPVNPYPYAYRAGNGQRAAAARHRRPRWGRDGYSVESNVIPLALNRQERRRRSRRSTPKHARPTTVLSLADNVFSDRGMTNRVSQLSVLLILGVALLVWLAPPAAYVLATAWVVKTWWHPRPRLS